MCRINVSNEVLFLVVTRGRAGVAKTQCNKRPAMIRRWRDREARRGCITLHGGVLFPPQSKAAASA